MKVLLSFHPSILPFFPFIVLLLTASSCKTGKVDLHHLEKNGEVILSMERTACFGVCPVFEAKLYRNGLLLYNGKMFTDHTGCGYAQVTKQEMDELTRYIQQSGFFSLENKYPTEEEAPTDLPGCYLYFKSGTMEKRIENHYWQTPEVLTAIEKRVDSLIASKKLQFCDK